MLERIVGGYEWYKDTIDDVENWTIEQLREETRVPSNPPVTYVTKSVRNVIACKECINQLYKPKRHTKESKSCLVFHLYVLLNAKPKRE